MKRIAFEFVGAVSACFLGVGILGLALGIILAAWILQHLDRVER